LTDTGDDTYTASGSITCTFTGTIPVTGTLPGTVTCTSTHSLTVDIDTDGSLEINNIGPFSPGWTAGSTATTHNGVGGVTITITTPPQVSATLNTGNFDNNPTSAADEFDVAKSVNTIAPITGTITLPNTLTITGGTLQDSGAHSIDISSNEPTPSNDIVVPELITVAFPPPVTVALTATTTFLNNIPFSITIEEGAITTTVVDPDTGTVTGVLSGPSQDS
jgi:hypothetical protein